MVDQKIKEKRKELAFCVIRKSKIAQNKLQDFQREYLKLSLPNKKHTAMLVHI